MGELPQRIVSMVPSQTELLCDLGLEESVVGITRYCTRPRHWLQSKAVVGGTKNPDIERIRTLRPDLILTNREENRREDIEALRQICEVWVSDITSLPEAIQMIFDVGRLTGTMNAAKFLAEEILSTFKPVENQPAIPVAYLIWHQPMMVAAGDTFINDILVRGGFSNVFARQKRYPAISKTTLSGSGAQVILLSSEPYAFKEKHRVFYQKLLPEAKVICVDGELFSWYGSRLRFTAAYLKELHRLLKAYA